MGNFWEGLVKIMPALKNAKDLFKLFSGNKTIVIKNESTTTINAEKVVQINLNGLTGDQKESLSLLIKKSFDGNDALLLEENADSTVSDFNEVQQRSEDTLNYFKGKLPKQDLIILRAALFIKILHEDGQPVGKLKSDLVQRYGERAKNITNLCTAGYFDSLIKPLYEELSQKDNFTLQNFLEKYDILVSQYPFAVFVCHGMSIQEIKTIILEKIEINKKYGVNAKFIRVHGIGQENMKKISGVLNDEELLSKLTGSPEIESGQNFITVRIWFMPFAVSPTTSVEQPPSGQVYCSTI